MWSVETVANTLAVAMLTGLALIPFINFIVGTVVGASFAGLAGLAVGAVVAALITVIELSIPRVLVRRADPEACSGGTTLGIDKGISDGRAEWHPVHPLNSGAPPTLNIFAPPRVISEAAGHRNPHAATVVVPAAPLNPPRDLGGPNAQDDFAHCFHSLPWIKRGDYRSAGRDYPFGCHPSRVGLQGGLNGPEG